MPLSLVSRGLTSFTVLVLYKLTLSYVFIVFLRGFQVDRLSPLQYEFVGVYLIGENLLQVGFLGERASLKGECDLNLCLFLKMERLLLSFSLISMFPIFTINFIRYNINMKQDNRIGFQYIDGDDDVPLIGSGINCCGGIVGFCKAWIPCVGCFCCCFQNPFVQIPQGSKGLLLKFKKYSQTCKSGLHYVNPISQQMIIIDCRISVIALPVQRLMTRDNISITIDSCLYYHVIEPHLTYFRVDNLESTLVKTVGGLIKSTVAAFTFQDLLQKKSEITHDIMTGVLPIIKHWGIVIDSICLKNFGISKQLENELVSAPIARRNAESKVINAQAQVEIAKMLGERSKILDSKTAIQVRYLQTLKDLARNSNTRMIYRSH